MGLLEAAKPLGTRTLVGRLEVLDRFGLHDVVLSGELYSPLWPKASGFLSAAVGIDPDFAPRWTLGGEVFQNLKILHPALSFLEPSLSYRHLSFRTAEVDLLIPGLTVYFPGNIWLTEKVYYVLDPSSVTVSSQLTWRGEPPSGYSSSLLARMGALPSGLLPCRTLPARRCTACRPG